MAPDAGILLRGEAVAHPVGVEEDEVARRQLQGLEERSAHVLAEHAVVRDEAGLRLAEATDAGVADADVVDAGHASDVVEMTCE